MDQIIGLQLYSIRDEMKKDFSGSLEKVKAAGYNAVEFADFYGNSATFIKSEMDRIGLIPFSAHIGYEMLSKKIDDVCEFSRELGLSWVVCPGYEIKSPEDCAKISAILANAARNLEPLGIRVAYHNHYRELDKFFGKYIFDMIIQNNEGVKVYAEIDTCWVQYAGVDPVEFIDNKKDLAGPFHFKDINTNYQEIKSSEINVEVGNGIIDFPAIIEVARKNGVIGNGIFVEQEAFTRDMFESIKISCDNIKILLRGQEPK